MERGGVIEQLGRDSLSKDVVVGTGGVDKKSMAFLGNDTPNVCSKRTVAVRRNQLLVKAMLASVFLMNLCAGVVLVDAEMTSTNDKALRQLGNPETTYNNNKSQRWRPAQVGGPSSSSSNDDQQQLLSAEDALDLDFIRGEIENHQQQILSRFLSPTTVAPAVGGSPTFPPTRINSPSSPAAPPASPAPTDMPAPSASPATQVPTGQLVPTATKAPTGPLGPTATKAPTGLSAPTATKAPTGPSAPTATKAPTVPSEPTATHAPTSPSSAPTTTQAPSGLSAPTATQAPSGPSAPTAPSPIAPMAADSTFGTPANNAASNPPKSSGGLTPGVKALIAIAVLAVVALALYINFGRRRNGPTNTRDWPSSPGSSVTNQGQPRGLSYLTQSNIEMT